MNATGWSRGLEVTGGGTGVVSHAGLMLLREAVEALPPALRRRLMVTCDGAGASHELVKELDRLASRHGYQITWSVGWALGAREQQALGKVPETAWEAAIGGKG